MILAIKDLPIQGLEGFTELVTLLKPMQKLRFWPSITAPAEPAWLKWLPGKGSDL
jgi:hypothetical protein